MATLEQILGENPMSFLFDGYVPISRRILTAEEFDKVIKSIYKCDSIQELEETKTNWKYARGLSKQNKKYLNFTIDNKIDRLKDKEVNMNGPG